MKFYHYLLIAVLILSTNANAFESKIEIFEQFDNLRLVSFISVEDINDSPEWNPEKGAPPLAVTEAIKAVTSFVKATKTIKEIEIRPLHKYEKKWHYLIKTVNNSKKSKYEMYVVLMNGKVIPAIIEPQGYK